LPLFGKPMRSTANGTRYFPEPLTDSIFSGKLVNMDTLSDNETTDMFGVPVSVGDYISIFDNYDLRNYIDLGHINTAIAFIERIQGKEAISVSFPLGDENTPKLFSLKRRRFIKLYRIKDETLYSGIPFTYLNALFSDELNQLNFDQPNLGEDFLGNKLEVGDIVFLSSYGVSSLQVVLDNGNPRIDEHPFRIKKVQASDSPQTPDGKHVFIPRLNSSIPLQDAGSVVKIFEARLSPCLDILHGQERHACRNPKPLALEFYDVERLR
jgi:hypothetical protein